MNAAIYVCFSSCTAAYLPTPYCFTQYSTHGKPRSSPIVHYFYKCDLITILSILGMSSMTERWPKSSFYINSSASSHGGIQFANIRIETDITTFRQVSCHQHDFFDLAVKDRVKNLHVILRNVVVVLRLAHWAFTPVMLIAITGGVRFWNFKEEFKNKRRKKRLKNLKTQKRKEKHGRQCF